jgi:hypothetical protein
MMPWQLSACVFLDAISPAIYINKGVDYVRDADAFRDHAGAACCDTSGRKHRMDGRWERRP